MVSRKRRDGRPLLSREDESQIRRMAERGLRGLVRDLYNGVDKMFPHDPARQESGLAAARRCLRALLKDLGE